MMKQVLQVSVSFPLALNFFLSSQIKGMWEEWTLGVEGSSCRRQAPEIILVEKKILGKKGGAGEMAHLGDCLLHCAGSLGFSPGTPCGSITALGEAQVL